MKKSRLKMTVKVWSSDFKDFPHIYKNLFWLMNAGLVRKEYQTCHFIVFSGLEYWLEKIFK